MRIPLQVSRQVLIQNRRGLHARASAQVVRLAESFKTQNVQVRYQEMCVSAQSIMGLLMLGAAQGSVLTIEAEGPDAEQVVTALVALIEGKFGEV